MTSTQIPIQIREQDSPEKLFRDIDAAVTEMDADEHEALNTFIEAIDTANNKIKEASDQLDDVLADMKSALADEPPTPDGWKLLQSGEENEGQSSDAS